VRLLDKISARTTGQSLERRNSIDTWLSELLLPSQFNYAGNGYNFGGMGLNQTWIGSKVAEVSHDLPGYMAALRHCPPAFAAQMIRAQVLSQARFTFRNPPWHPRTPRRTFGTSALKTLEQPWRNATTGELVGRMEWHAGMSGNAYVARRPDRLRVLRPDWVAILYGSDLEPEDPAHAIDGELLGYIYCNGGLHGPNRVVTLLPEDVAHWSPMPDPLNAGIGMSWLTPAIRDIQADRLATEHKVTYFKNGATPNLVIKGITATDKTQFDQIVAMMEAGHAGAANAYKTLYLTAGADATVVGSNLRDLDLKSVQGASETRIAMLSRVHPTILAVAEGLAGSSLNAGNFGMARRIWADSWIYPTLQDLASSLAPMVRVPGDAEMWFDPSDMPILREDARDAAEIVQIQVSTIVSGASGGFKPMSVVDAVKTQDVGLLEHTGMLSVQLQKPGAEDVAAEPATDPVVDERSMAEPASCDWDPTEADPDEVFVNWTEPRAATPAGAAGGAQLHSYWTKGEGLAKWASSPHPWTALYRHLVRHMPPGKAKRTAAQWFHDVFGIWPGHRKGKNPGGPG
jgi:phage portal protein BeeE